MGSKALTGGIALALDRARIAPMSPDSAVAFLDEVKNESKHKETAKAWADRYASPLEAAKSGHIDDIIDSAELRQRIGAALAMLL
jgi:acetyl-CoA carboxylase carboxyltransferase component